jgi:hypothetical protein
MNFVKFVEIISQTNFAKSSLLYIVLFTFANLQHLRLTNFKQNVKYKNIYFLISSSEL